MIIEHLSLQYLLVSAAVQGGISKKKKKVFLTLIQSFERPNRHSERALAL